MKFSFRPALALLLLASSATLLTACDYTSLSPGDNPQSREGFANPPGYTKADVNRDSINGEQEVHTPIGKGSATAIKNGSTQDKLDAAPAGKSAASPQTASGKMGPVDQAQNQSKGNASGGEKGNM